MFFRKDYKRLKVENYTQVLEQTEQRSEYCAGLPMHLWINTSNICNLNCIMCGRQGENFLTANPIKFMDEIIFQKAARECFPTLCRLNLSITGEPTLSPHFPEILKTAKKYRVKVNINTNVMLLNQGDTMQLILENGGEVVASFDGATKATFETIRRGSCFEEIVAALDRFHLLRQEIYPPRRPRLTFSIVIMRKNIEELPDIIQKIKQWQPDGGAIVHVAPHSPSMESESLKHYPELSDHYLQLARQEAKNLGLELHFPPLFKEQVPAPAGSPVFCALLWSQSWIMEDGTITTCCHPSPARPRCGNLKQQTFAEIWNGPVYRALRRGMAQGNPHPMCYNCYWQDQGLAGEAVEKFIF